MAPWGAIVLKKSLHFASDSDSLTLGSMTTEICDDGQQAGHAARFVDLEDICAQLKPYYSATSRPSIDSELMIRMLIAGYCLGIGSERRLCEEVNLSLAYRWFCKLNLTDRVPDHSTFSKNRHGRFRESDLLRKVFETVLARCIAERVVGGEAFTVDASTIKANANRQQGGPSISRPNFSFKQLIQTSSAAAARLTLHTVPRSLSKGTIRLMVYVNF